MIITRVFFLLQLHHVGHQDKTAIYWYGYVCKNICGKSSVVWVPALLNQVWMTKPRTTDLSIFNYSTINCDKKPEKNEKQFHILWFHSDNSELWWKTVWRKWFQHRALKHKIHHQVDADRMKKLNVDHAAGLSTWSSSLPLCFSKSEEKKREYVSCFVVLDLF